MSLEFPLLILLLRSKVQVQVENLDLQPTDQQESDPNEQATHSTCSTQTEAFDYLYRSVESLSIKDCPRSDASTQTEEFDYLFAESVTSKPFDKNYFKEDNGKVSFYTGLPTFEVLKPLLIMLHPMSNEEHNPFLYFKRWLWY